MIMDLSPKGEILQYSIVYPKVDAVVVAPPAGH